LAFLSGEAVKLSFLFGRSSPNEWESPPKANTAMTNAGRQRLTNDFLKEKVRGIGAQCMRGSGLLLAS
jgi:hypothetical protein